MIRLFTISDTENCRKIIEKCFDESVVLEKTAKKYVKNMYLSKGYLESKSKEYTFFVYEKNKKVIALGGIKENMIKTLYVAPEEQGKKIGCEMLSYLENIAVKNGYTDFVLDSWENSVGFYKKHRYSIVKHFIRKDNGVKIPIIIMKKVL